MRQTPKEIQTRRYLNAETEELSIPALVKKPA